MRAAGLDRMASTHSASSFNKDLNARVREALGRTEILALSTLGPDGPWTSPVQFRFNLELFFLSMREAKHVQNITQDARVSVAIYSHPGPPGGTWACKSKARRSIKGRSPLPTDGRASGSSPRKSGASIRESLGTSGAVSILPNCSCSATVRVIRE